MYSPHVLAKHDYNNQYHNAKQYRRIRFSKVTCVVIGTVVTIHGHLLVPMVVYTNFKSH
jgi:hypothetical protein